MKVTVVIVSRNTRQMVLDCLASVLKTAPSDTEIILVDNASSDGTQAAVRESYPGVRLVENDRNAGFGIANNQGAALAGGEALFFLNSDTIVHDGAIDRLAAAMKCEKRLGAAGPELVSADGARQETAAFLMTPDTEFSSAARREARRRTDEAVARGEDLAGIAYLSGAALMVRKAAFDQLKGFDESIFLYYEDADLIKRMADAGWSIRVTEDAQVVHFGGSSAQAVRAAAAIEALRSRFQYIGKHFGDGPARLAQRRHTLGRSRRAAVAAAQTIVTLGLSSRVREKAGLYGAMAAWLLLGSPARTAPIYRRLFGEWES